MEREPVEWGERWKLTNRPVRSQTEVLVVSAGKTLNVASSFDDEWILLTMLRGCLSCEGNAVGPADELMVAPKTELILNAESDSMLISQTLVVESGDIGFSS